MWVAQRSGHVQGPAVAKRAISPGFRNYHPLQQRHHTGAPWTALRALHIYTPVQQLAGPEMAADAQQVLSQLAHSGSGPQTPARPVLQALVAPQSKDTRQESDLLDEIKPGKNCCDEATNNVRLVSLGCYCGPKLSFQQIGRGAETLPFDWVRTRLDGVLHFLRTNFAGFFDFVTQMPVPGTSGNMVMYRSHLHSFWHDNPTEPSMQEKYRRRIARLMKMNADQQPVLFVRSVGSTDELPRAGELLSELTLRFGRHSKLLLIVDFQSTPHGPFVVQGYPNLLIYLFCREAHDTSGLGPYNAPVRCGLDWAVGRPVGEVGLPSLEAALQAAQPTNFGDTGLGGLLAFEEPPAGGVRTPQRQFVQQRPAGAALSIPAVVLGVSAQPRFAPAPIVGVASHHVTLFPSVMIR